MLSKRLLYEKNWKKENHQHCLEWQRKYRKKNRNKVNSWARDWYNKNTEKELDRMRLKRFGISGIEFRKKLKEQKGKCPICQQILTKNPSVDHNHIIGKIRGLICNKCNLAIGNAEDSPKRLRAMARYLERENHA